MTVAHMFQGIQHVLKIECVNMLHVYLMYHANVYLIVEMFSNLVAPRDTSILYVLS